MWPRPLRLLIGEEGRLVRPDVPIILLSGMAADERLFEAQAAAQSLSGQRRKPWWKFW